MGDAAALPDHHRRRAQAPPAPQDPDRTGRHRSALKPRGWLEVFSRIGARVRDVALPLTGTEAGRAALSVGAGGDTTVELDRAAEAVVFAELEALAARGESFSVLSEEAGLRHFGADYPLVLVDPIDGSLNAKQGVPLFALMLAVLDGPEVGDAVVGMVLNLSTGEEWRVIQGEGASRGGRSIVPLAPGNGVRIELLGLESLPRALQVARPLVERAFKIRILGSMAISIAITSAGGFDVFCAPLPVRVFDMAASLLLLAETGGVATDLQGRSLDHLRCDLETRTTLLCAPHREMHEHALKLFSAAQ